MKWRLILLTLISLSCNSKRNNFHLFASYHKTTKIYIQPFDDLPPTLSSYAISEIKKFFPEVLLLKPVHLPRQSWYEPRNRYRADSLIYWLKNRVNDDEVVIGLTSKDISTTKNGIKDWGVMGLGYRPGKSCIASTFRLSRQNLKHQFFKVAIHELGHTQGLDHCPVKTCFMRDAEGGNPTNEEKEFCQNCRRILLKKGWNL
jgi:archaemetzincin